jgi:hypothetical protein
VVVMAILPAGRNVRDIVLHVLMLGTIAFTSVLSVLRPAATILFIMAVSLWCAIVPGYLFIAVTGAVMKLYTGHKSAWIQVPVAVAFITSSLYIRAGWLELSILLWSHVPNPPDAIYAALMGQGVTSRLHTGGQLEGLIAQLAKLFVELSLWGVTIVPIIWFFVVSFVNGSQDASNVLDRMHRAFQRFMNIEENPIRSFGMAVIVFVTVLYALVGIPLVIYFQSDP